MRGIKYVGTVTGLRRGLLELKRLALQADDKHLAANLPAAWTAMAKAQVADILGRLGGDAA